MGSPRGQYRCCHCVDCEPPFKDGGREEESRRHLQANV
uniref:Uncharacterized protein n=1 Tax=Myoviridae sp. ctLEM34 TaxID=2825082 RepID=A0A8S5TR07_9CAUD|nr:MAG TPA: hypothetical protein [Myoviridae sp. ctLEM34]